MYHNITNIPVRPQASPRPSPPFSPTISATRYDFLRLVGEVEPGPFTSLKDGVQNPQRGRTLHRIPALSRTISRETTRGHVELDLADLEWRRRSKTQEVNKTPEGLDYSPLEPMPPERFRLNLSEELDQAAIRESSIDITRFANHRDTFAVLVLHQPQQPRCPTLPLMLLPHIAPHLNLDAYKAARLTCYSWSMALPPVRSIKYSPIGNLPAEILKRIYMELSPLDFNAARHACRAWMIASLEEKFLWLMMKRGGWSGAISADKEVKPEQDLEYRTMAISEDWLLGKRLATECSLTPGWSGNGVDNLRMVSTGLRLTCGIDLSELSIASLKNRDEWSHQAPHFAVSACSKFLLVFRSCDIYVYALRGYAGDGHVHPCGGNLKLWSRIHSPAPVLAVSMDTSSQQYAVAALLRGSIGIVYDVFPASLFAQQSSPRYARSRHRADSGIRGLMQIQRCFDERSSGKTTIHTCAMCSTNLGASRDQIHGAIHQPLLEQTVSYTHDHSDPGNGNGSWTVFDDVCSLDDPPRTVAICPQRRCVAFGCQKGVELRWVDDLTQHHLKRWFPLPAPSDILFFMPSTGESGNTKKLKFISSSRRIDTRRDAQKHDSNLYEHGEHTARCDLDFNPYKGGALSTDAYPSYCRAVPLSDGYNVLYTLPTSRVLCVGHEGLRGPNARKLVKRFIFVGPKDEHGINITPCLYAAATELRWGLRVAAVYSDQLWLFVVPPDLFLESSLKRKKFHASNATRHKPPVPTQVAGVKVTTISGLESLALDASAGDLTLWAFSQNAKAYVFQLSGNSSRAVTQRAAMSNGTVVLTRDADGDTVMTDAPDPRGREYPSRHHHDCSASHSPHMSSTLLSCLPPCVHVCCNGLHDAASCAILPCSDDSFKSRDTCRPADFVRCDKHSPFAHCLPACDHRYRDHPFDAESSVSDDTLFHSSFTSFPDDEGYASGTEEEFDLADGHVASWWNEDEDTEGISHQQKKDETNHENEGSSLDEMDLGRCECEFVGV